jgi:hypothetical protein
MFVTRPTQANSGKRGFKDGRDTFANVRSPETLTKPLQEVKEARVLKIIKCEM